ARRAHPAIHAARVRQVPDAAGVLPGERPGDRPRAVRRAVVDEEELPVVPRLREHAGDRLAQEGRGVQEDGDGRDSRHVAQATAAPRARQARSAAANASPSQSRTWKRGSWNASLPAPTGPSKFEHAQAKPVSRTIPTVPAS